MRRPLHEGRAGEPIRWLLAGQFLMFIGIAAVFPVAPLYVRHHGGGATAAALFVAGALIANSIVQIPAGWLVDRIGRRPVLLTARTAFAALALVIFFADAAPLWALAVLRTAQGAAAGAYVPALLAAIADLSSEKRRAELFSRLQAAETGGLLIGPFVGGVAALWRDSAVFLCTGVLVLLGVLLQRRVGETRGPSARVASAPVPPLWWRSRGIAVSLAGLLTLGLVFSMYDVVWPQYLSARGAGTVLIGLSISLFALPMVLLAGFGGRLADRSDRRVVLGACFALTGICCASYPALRSIPLIVTVGLGEACAVLMCEPTLYAALADAGPEAARGRAMGLGGFFHLGGSGAGAAVLGSLYGLREGLPFWSGAGAMLLTAALSAAALPPRRPACAPPPQTLPHAVGRVEGAERPVVAVPDDGGESRREPPGERAEIVG